MIALLLACSSPPDPVAIFRAHRAELAGLCETFPKLGVDGVGVEPGRMVLTHGETWLFEGPTDADLAAAGLVRPAYDDVVTRLRKAEVLQIYSEADGVRFIVGMSGLSVSGSETWIHCGPVAPAPPPVPGPPTGDGSECEPLDAGWWSCLEWT